MEIYTLIEAHLHDEKDLINYEMLPTIKVTPIITQLSFLIRFSFQIYSTRRYFHDT